MFNLMLARLNDTKFLQSLLLAIGATYPLNTLTRRLSLLSKAETNKANGILYKIETLTEQLDAIISSRAENTKGERWP